MHRRRKRAIDGIKVEGYPNNIALVQELAQCHPCRRTILNEFTRGKRFNTQPIEELHLLGLAINSPRTQMKHVLGEERRTRDRVFPHPIMLDTRWTKEFQTMTKQRCERHAVLEI